MDFYLHPLGDHAVIIELGNEISEPIHNKVKAVTSSLDQQPFEWMVEYVPAFTTVTIFYDPIHVFRKDQAVLPYDYVCQEISDWLDQLHTSSSAEPRVVEIPVLYGGDAGPDLEYVANHNQLTPEEVVNIHTGGDYLVYMIGFAPGFPYIGGMSEKIAAPRRKSPRLSIPAGSVGIAGEQTGVYPIESPGGWQLIGRTPLALFQPDEKHPSLLQAGDTIRFTSITKQEYDQWGDGI